MNHNTFYPYKIIKWCNYHHIHYQDTYQVYIYSIYKDLDIIIQNKNFFLNIRSNHKINYYFINEHLHLDIILLLELYEYFSK